MKKICNSCGGVLGVDCFNPQECEQITQSMNNEQAKCECWCIEKTGIYPEVDENYFCEHGASVSKIVEEMKKLSDPQKLKDEWEKDFDYIMEPFDGSMAKNYPLTICVIKEFIKNQLSVQQKDFDARVDGFIKEAEKSKKIKKVDYGHDCYEKRCNYCEGSIYDEGISDLVALAKQMFISKHKK